MPVACPDIAAHKIRKQRELHRFPDGDAADDRKRGDPRHEEVGTALKRVVFSLHRMIASYEEIEPRHLPRVTEEAAPRNDVAPFAVQVNESDVDESVQHEHPHHREMPVARAGKPSAERRPGRYRLPFPWITAEGFAAPRKPRVSVEDSQSAPDHDRERDDVHPVGEPDNPMVSRSRHRQMLSPRMSLTIDLF